MELDEEHNEGDRRRVSHVLCRWKAGSLEPSLGYSEWLRLSGRNYGRVYCAGAWLRNSQLRAHSCPRAGETRPEPVLLTIVARLMLDGSARDGSAFGIRHRGLCWRVLERLEQPWAREQPEGPGELHSPVTAPVLSGEYGCGHLVLHR